MDFLRLHSFKLKGNSNFLNLSMFFLDLLFRIGSFWTLSRQTWSCQTRSSRIWSYWSLRVRLQLKKIWKRLKRERERESICRKQGNWKKAKKFLLFSQNWISLKKPTQRRRAWEREWRLLKGIKGENFFFFEKGNFFSFRLHSRSTTMLLLLSRGRP